MLRSASPGRRRAVAVLLALVVLLGTVPGLAAAETRSGGTVVVEAGETVDGLEAYGGSIVVRGTVNGDLQAFGGDVRVQGEVTGNVDAVGGNVLISGDVGGDVEASGGNVFVEPGAEIAGSLSVGAGSVLVAGTVHGDAELAGGSVTLAPTATIDGDVEYAVGEEGEFVDEGATVGGTISRNPDLEPGAWEGPSVPWWAFSIYGFLANLLLGAILLLVFPRFSRGIAERAAERPLRSAGVGLLGLIGVPIALIVLVLTVVGIPLALLGAILFGLLVWVALVYGRFAVGAWLLAHVGAENRWVALLVGLVLLALLARLPWIGWLFDLAVVLLGLGAMLALGYAGYRDRRAA